MVRRVGAKAREAHNLVDSLRTSRLLEILQNATRIGNRKLLCRNNLIIEILGNVVWWSHFLIKTHEYGIQRRTLLNFGTDAFVNVFWNSFTENFEKYMKKNMCSGVPL